VGEVMLTLGRQIWFWNFGYC